MLTLLVLAACSSVPPVQQRRELAQALARDRDWHAESLHSGVFDIESWLPPKMETSGTLVIYIEGDGLAYRSGDRPSTDPTPLFPMALHLALEQPGGNAAVLDRPCQYLEDSSRCDERYWTTGRFAPEVIDAMNRATDTLVEHFRADRLILVGYSGGAAVAALLAVRRTDVVGLVTVAGNLDHRAWTDWHRVSPLTGSLNPADEATALMQVPQMHLSGARDRVVPPELLEQFAARIPGARLEILDGYDHHCCWAENWAAIWRSIPWDAWPIRSAPE